MSNRIKVAISRDVGGRYSRYHALGLSSGEDAGSGQIAVETHLDSLQRSSAPLYRATKGAAAFMR